MNTNAVNFFTKQINSMHVKNSIRNLGLGVTLLTLSS